MSDFNITLTVSGTVGLTKNAETGEYEAQVSLNQPVLNGIEYTTKEQDEKHGKAGARIAAVALLELCAQKIRTGDQEPTDNVVPTMPEASA